MSSDLRGKTGYRILSDHPIYKVDNRVIVRVQKVAPPRILGVIEYTVPQWENFVLPKLNEHDSKTYGHMFSYYDDEHTVTWDKQGISDFRTIWAKVNGVGFGRNWATIDSHQSIVTTFQVNIEVIDMVLEMQYKNYSADDFDMLMKHVRKMGKGAILDDLVAILEAMKIDR
jgi:hypothetical protein